MARVLALAFALAMLEGCRCPKEEPPVVVKPPKKKPPPGLTPQPSMKLAMKELDQQLLLIKGRLEQRLGFREEAKALASLALRIPTEGKSDVFLGMTRHLAAWANDLAITPPPTQRRSFNKIVDACRTCHVREAPSQVKRLLALRVNDPSSIISAPGKPAIEKRPEKPALEKRPGKRAP